MRLAISTLLIASVCAPALAQQQSGAISYDAQFFAPFQPRTARDMVERVPGFSIDAGEERRGFAGAQSNVLIDGQPPTSKAQEIEDVLARIPAQDVIRIELIRGAGSSAGSSQSVRVNIVRRPSSGDGVWELGFAAARDGFIAPSGEAAWTGRRGNLEYGVSAAYDAEHLPVEGERTDFDASGAVTERRRERVPSDEREARLSAEASFPLAGGALALNGQLSSLEFEEAELGERFGASGVGVGSIDASLIERESAGEIGLSYRRDFGGWQGEFAAVLIRRRSEADETNVERDALGAFEESAEQGQRLESGETILRAQAERELGDNWSVTIAVEAALNTLEQRLALIEDDGAGPEPIVLPSANVRVEEERSEASFMLSGRPRSDWTLEAGAAVETSELGQSGDANRNTQLTYWKPSVQLARALGDRNQWRLRFYRDVGQLDFEDFVSAADITSSIVDGGNPDLRPETSWRIEATGDWRFGEEGAFSVTLYRWWVEDTLDIIPVGAPGDEFDAPGNIGDADVAGLRASLSLPLPFGVDLRLEGFTQQSEATDPLTGEQRSISVLDESSLSVKLRQDLQHFAWGVDFEQEREAPEWRLDRIEREEDAEDLTLWLETTAFADVKLRAWASNLTDSAETRRRRIFGATRLGALDRSDARARREGLSFGVSAGGAF
jgi:hypothetical protein